MNLENKEIIWGNKNMKKIQIVLMNSPNKIKKIFNNQTDKNKKAYLIVMKKIIKKEFNHHMRNG